MLIGLDYCICEYGYAYWNITSMRNFACFYYLKYHLSKKLEKMIS